MSPAVARTFLALTLGLGLLSCGGTPEATPAAGAEAGGEAAATRTYAVRGLVRGLQGRELTVAHEAIPGLVGPTGAADPMEAMTMTFPLADPIDPATLAPGDKVSFTLEIDWTATDPARVVAIEALPADTELALR